MTSGILFFIFSLFYFLFFFFFFSSFSFFLFLPLLHSPFSSLVWFPDNFSVPTALVSQQQGMACPACLVLCACLLGMLATVNTLVVLELHKLKTYLLLAPKVHCWQMRVGLWSEPRCFSKLRLWAYDFWQPSTLHWNSPVYKSQLVINISSFSIKTVSIWSQ